MRLERANSKKPVNWLSLLGLVLIPIIVAAGFILATWKSGDRLETIEAAIVNNDDGAKVDGKTVPIGRQLTSGLVGEDENNIHWVITDEEVRRHLRREADDPRRLLPRCDLGR